MAGEVVGSINKICDPFSLPKFKQGGGDYTGQENRHYSDEYPPGDNEDSILFENLV